jgi:UDP-N-acetyl-D-mannosaminuronic acid transferase (WecB/TagA/CpsF family)
MSLYFVKQNIANVLIDKVKSGYFSENEAKKIAKMILYDKAKLLETDIIQKL